MWKGRFSKETSDLVKRYGESVSFDWRLYAHDIRGSIAHSKALVGAGVLTASEGRRIASGLREIEREIREGKFQWDLGLEDVHMNIESALTRKTGAAGAKLHTARSRNDQVALDVRMYCRDQAAEIRRLIHGLQRALLDCAERHVGAVMPGYTHLQRGQPVLFAHHLLAYVEMLERDAGRLDDACRRLDVLPLGSGALAGSTIVLDRAAIARDLGFSAISHNSMDAVSDRDFVAELLAAIALCGVHLSRFAEDVILWASAEFGFIALDDRHTTGSSLMPQKKNPDVAELTRGKAARLIGNLTSLLVLLKGLPMTYNRDLQEDKERLFDSIDTILMALEVNAEMVAGLKVVEAVVRAAAADPMLLATDLAEHLVMKGVPFREAHEVVGRLTAFCLAGHRSFIDLSVEEFRRFSPAFGSDVTTVLDLGRSLAARGAVGAPSPANVRRECRAWKTRLRRRRR